MSQWFLAFDGERIGPLGHAQAVAEAYRRPDGFAWREGFTDWVPIKSVSELRPEPRSSQSVAPPPMGRRSSDAVDFEIHGTEMQFVEVELDPGESAVAEAGAMLYKDPAITMSAVLGDGSESGNDGLLDKLVGTGKRVLSGAGMFMTLFTHTGQGKARVAFAAPSPGMIIPINLTNMGGELICQRDAFLCAAKGVSIGIFLQRRIMTGLFGGEGFVMQKLEGDGLVCVHAGGTVVERTLGVGERLQLDTGCLVAIEPSVKMDIAAVGGVRTMLLAGEGMFLTTLTGPGNVWIQSLPFSRMAGRILSASPKRAR